MNMVIKMDPLFISSDYTELICSLKIVQNFKRYFQKKRMQQLNI